MKLSNISLVLTVLLPLCLGNVLALSNDREQQIQIEADQAEADDIQGYTKYSGQVVIVQGSLRIEADTVTIYFGDDSEMSKMIAVGGPAKFTQQPDGDVSVQNATANTLRYFAVDNIIELQGNAKSWQGDRRIEGEKIVYDTLRGRVKADSTKTLDGGDSQTGSDRVKITLPGKKKTQTP